MWAYKGYDLRSELTSLTAISHTHMHTHTQTDTHTRHLQYSYPILGDHILHFYIP